MAAAAAAKVTAAEALAMNAVSLARLIEVAARRDVSTVVVQA